MAYLKEEIYMKICKYDKEPKEVILNLVSELEKKDRQIDLMADEIIKLIYNSFSEIENDLPYVDDSIKQTKINVIEYFKNKVEEDK